MSLQQLTRFVGPVTQPLDEVHAHLSIISAAYRDSSTKLHMHASNLTQGVQGFQGSGARAFTSIVEYYTGAMENYCQALDNGASAAKTCSTQVKSANDTASSSQLDASIVAHTLNQLTIDTILRQGGSAIDPIMQQLMNIWQRMQNTWNDLQKTLAHEDKLMNDANNAGNQEWKDLFTLNFGGVFNDVGRYWGDQWQKMGDWGQELSDYAQLGAEGLQLLWEAIQLAWQVLREWGNEIFQAVSSCLSFIRSITTTAMHDITAFMDKIGPISQEILKDAQTALTDEEKGDDLGALAALMEMVINPELMISGQQMVDQEQIKKILEDQAPGLFEKFHKLPLWAKIAIILTLIAGLSLLAFAAKSGGGISADQQKRINSIHQQLANQGINASNAEIQALIVRGYSDEGIIAVLKTANLSQSGNMYIQDTRGGLTVKTYGHTLIKHVNISNKDLKARAANERPGRPTTTYNDAETAQQAINHAIANSTILQDFIVNGGANQTASDTVCYPDTSPKNIGYGYKTGIGSPPSITRIGPLHCMLVVLAKNILGKIFVLTSYPVEKR